MFKLGVRNIPRRRAQTTLIVLGLMLSTVIISAAFTTGDTVDRSITSEVYGLLGSVDEVVSQASASNDDDAFDGDDPSQAAVRDQSFAPGRGRAAHPDDARRPRRRRRRARPTPTSPSP